MLFKKQFKHLHQRITNQENRWHDLDMKMFSMNRSLDTMHEQYNAMRIIKADMAKMDALAAMCGEMALRLDKANVPELPKGCTCGGCICNVAVDY